VSSDGIIETKLVIKLFSVPLSTALHPLMGGYEGGGERYTGAAGATSSESFGVTRTRLIIVLDRHSSQSTYHMRSIRGKVIEVHDARDHSEEAGRDNQGLSSF
jgi:hypothetical protein